MRSAPASSARAAHAAGSPNAVPQAFTSRADQSSGVRSLTSTAMTGLLGTLPSKWRKGNVVSPPTVTVPPRVPPSAVPAPRVTSVILPVHVSLTSGTVTDIRHLLSCSHPPAVRLKISDPSSAPGARAPP